MNPGADWEALDGFSIPKAIDDHYRRQLCYWAAIAGGESLRTEVYTALQDGPSKGGRPEVERYFGPGYQDLISARVAPLIEYLEFCDKGGPGLMKWLDRTGFGNDLGLIKAMLRWAGLRGPILVDLDPATRGKG